MTDSSKVTGSSSGSNGAPTSRFSAFLSCATSPAYRAALGARGLDLGAHEAELERGLGAEFVARRRQRVVLLARAQRLLRDPQLFLVRGQVHVSVGDFGDQGELCARRASSCAK